MAHILANSVPMTQVALSVSAQNLRNRDVTSKSDPACVLYMNDNEQKKFVEIGRTDVIKNDLNPSWVKQFEVDYHFEERQVLQFHVYDWDTKATTTNKQDSLGYVECSLGEIMAHQGGQFKKELSRGGTLFISGTELSSSKEIISLEFRGKDLDKKDLFGKSDPFLIISRSAGGNNFTPIHKTEIVKNSLDPYWKLFSIPVQILCCGDYDQTLKIECCDWDSDGSHDLIGECLTTMKDLLDASNNIHSLINPKKKAKKSSYKDSGKLIISHSSTHIVHTFLDYIQGGLQIHFTIAIDFTGSNGDPRSRNSLHYFEPGVDNQYSVAIKGVGEVIQDYDSDRLFPALGFGAKIPPQWEVSHEFFLNGRADTPFCQGLQGILAAYENSLRTVRLYGPTNFAPVIRHVMKFAATNQDGNNFFVLAILTDGIITDLADTRKTLVEASKLPMSVIIIGVGDEDFSTMEMLDGDENRLSFNGVAAERDIVQFVELRKYMSESTSNHLSQSRLAKDVLAEIPNQLISWMKKREILPKLPKA